LDLNFKEFNIVNLKPIGTCTKLKRLLIDSTKGQIESLDGLQLCQQLELLELRDTPVKDTAALRKLNSLHEINLYSSTRTHLDLPENGTNLTTLLILGGPDLKTINSGTFSSTLSLQISSTGITEVPNLNGVIELMNLTLYNNKDLKNLNELSQIKTIKHKQIELQGCDALEDINGILQFEDIKLVLSLQRFPNNIGVNNVIGLELKNIKTLEGIEQFPKLRELVIKGWQPNLLPGELLPLQGLSELEILDISRYDGIQSLKGIGHLIKLRQLNLENTRLQDISELEKMKIDRILISGCNKKKKDFPAHLQNNIEWL